MNGSAGALDAVFDELYLCAEEARPSTERPIAPLVGLVGAYNLTCLEIAGLTSARASETLLARRAVLEAPANADATPLAGFLYATARYGTIFVEHGDRVTRRRFTVAHELGHHVLHFRPVLLAARDDVLPIAITDTQPAEPSEDATPADLPAGHVHVSNGAAALPPVEQMEREANDFAVELLMPAPLLSELAARYRRAFTGDDLVWRLATELLVSRAAMQWRLRGLGLLPVRTLWN